MGLDGDGEEAVSFELRAMRKESFDFRPGFKPGTSNFKLLSPPVENFNCFASLLKQTFTKPNTTNGNHEGIIRTFYPHRRSR
jgi:hypothetical protein